MRADRVYDEVEHLHRFAVWAAARAASRGGDRGTPTRHVAGWLKAIGLRKLIGSFELLAGPSTFDPQHREWREALTKCAGAGLTHGKAAKLIAIYLKSAVVCPSLAASMTPAQRASVGSIHPPIDRMLLKALGIRDVNWTSLTSDAYEQLIDELKPRATGPDGTLEFWRLEQVWTGYEGSDAG